MSKKKKIIISVIAAVLIIAVIVSAVVIAMTKGKNAAKASGVYANKVADVMYQAGSTDKYSGVVEAADTMDIKADSEKKVKDILVSEGDEVQVGTPLFTYDTKDLAAKKESATLELESLNNTLSGYDAQIEQLTKEKKEAPKDQQLDYTLQIQQAQTQQKQTQYDIATKKAEIEKYDESIKNATVNSTMIGVVKKINENQSADTADTAFMTIVATGDYRVKGTIDEQSFLNSGLAEGQAVIVRSRVDESKTWQGTISKVDTENTQTDNSNSGMYDDGSSEQKASKYNFYVQLTISLSFYVDMVSAYQFPTDIAHMVLFGRNVAFLFADYDILTHRVSSSKSENAASINLAHNVSPLYFLTTPPKSFVASSHIPGSAGLPWYFV